MKYPTTIKTLIDKLKDGDSVTWEEFYKRYHGIIDDVGHAKGLSDDECKDLVQEVMVCFFQKTATFKFDPNIAKFRTYFSRIVAGKIVDIFRRRMKISPDYTINESIAADFQEAPDVLFEQLMLERWRGLMLKQSKEILRTRINIKTYQAFELYAEQGRDINRVADALGMTTNQIYVAKNRCLRALSNILHELDEADPELELKKNGI